MRTKEEIKADLKDTKTTYSGYGGTFLTPIKAKTQELVLETLLDIREILQAKNN